LDAIYNAALDDEHKNQAAAWKLIMDRMLPLSYFDKDKAGGGRAAVSITITGVGGETTTITGEEDVIDV
jgi:multimeric flavodoxin WrbA